MASPIPIRSHNRLLVGTCQLKWPNNYIIDMCLSRALQKNNGLVKNIGCHSIAHWVALAVVASARRATGTFHSHCRTNETKTEPLAMHLRAIRDKCLIKRIRRAVCFAHQRKKFATPYAASGTTMTLTTTRTMPDANARNPLLRPRTVRAKYAEKLRRDNRIQSSSRKAVPQGDNVQRTLCQVLHMSLYAPTRHSARSDDQRLQKKRHLNMLDRNTISSSNDRTNDLNVTNCPTQQRD